MKKKQEKQILSNVPKRNFLSSQTVFNTAHLTMQAPALSTLCVNSFILRNEYFIVLCFTDEKSETTEKLGNLPKHMNPRAAT